jgi:hypothetical protein
VAKKKSVGEEVINHYGAVRLRVKGTAQLQLTLLSLDETQANVLVPIQINSLTNIEPNRLANFTQQRAKLQIAVTNINENFIISKIIVFIKPVAKSWPETS